MVLCIANNQLSDRFKTGLKNIKMADLAHKMADLTYFTSLILQVQ